MNESLFRKIQDAASAFRFPPRRAEPESSDDSNLLRPVARLVRLTRSEDHDSFKSQLKASGTQRLRPSLSSPPKGSRALRSKALRPADLSSRIAQRSHPEGRGHITDPSSRPRKLFNTWNYHQRWRPKDTLLNDATTLRAPLRTQPPPCALSTTLRRTQLQKHEAALEPSEQLVTFSRDLRPSEDDRGVWKRSFATRKTLSRKLRAASDIRRSPLQGVDRSGRPRLS